jgi:hypothetical protein
MRELHVDDADLAQLAVRDHAARLFDELMPGVAVGHADDLPTLAGQDSKLLGLGDREAEWLFTDHS